MSSAGTHPSPQQLLNEGVLEKKKNDNTIRDPCLNRKQCFRMKMTTGIRIKKKTKNLRERMGVHEEYPIDQREVAEDEESVIEILRCSSRVDGTA